MKINNVSKSKRCETCHQQDCFDPLANHCFRCNDRREPVRNANNRANAIKQWFISFPKHILAAALILFLVSTLGGVAWLYKTGVIGRSVEATETIDPIFEEIRKGSVEDVEKLIKAQPRRLSIRDKWGRSPLHYAVSLREAAIIDLLIRQDANLNALDEDGNQPIHTWSMTNYQDDKVFKLLLQSEKIDVVNNNNENLLHLAAENGREFAAERIIEELTERYKRDPEARGKYLKSFLDAKNNAGQTPLLKACSAGNTSLVKMLIKNGASLSVTDLKGNTPLHYAVKSGANDLVEFFIMQNLDTTAKNRDGDSPEALAQILEKSDISQLFNIYSQKTASHKH